MSVAVTENHCAYCFHVLEEYHFKNNDSSVTWVHETWSTIEAPLFVTWTKSSRKMLRGCIGTFSSHPLNYGLREYALISALKDSRFPPISKDEIPDLHCSVSLLCAFEPVSNMNDWEVGKHGLRLHIHDEYSATFLPHVAQEQGWDREATLKHLIRKSGYNGNTKHILNGEGLKDGLIRLERYQSAAYELSYNDYLALKRRLEN